MKKMIQIAAIAALLVSSNGYAWEWPNWRAWFINPGPGYQRITDLEQTPKSKLQKVKEMFGRTYVKPVPWAVSYKSTEPNGVITYTYSSDPTNKTQLTEVKNQKERNDPDMKYYWKTEPNNPWPVLFYTPKKKTNLEKMEQLSRHYYGE